MSGKPNVFVIMPFEDDSEDLYEDHLEPLFKDLEYNLHKADSLDSQRNILEDIVQGITSADLIVADLTGLNPNVFYELGIAHSVGIPTVLIAQDIEELPFDLQAYKTVEYSLRYDEVDVFNEKLRDIADKHKRGAVSFGSPVADHSDVKISEPTELEVEETASVQEGEEENTKKKETPPKKGILDYASESDEKLENLQDDLEYISTRTTNLGTTIESHAEEMTRLQNKQGRNARKRANSIAREAAHDIESYTASLGDKINPIEENLEFIMDAQETFIEVADSSDPEQQELMREQRNELNDYLDESEAAIRALSGFRQEAMELSGLNRELTKASRDLASTLSELISTLEEGSAKAERFISLIDKNLSE